MITGNIIDINSDNRELQEVLARIEQTEQDARLARIFQH